MSLEVVYRERAVLDKFVLRNFSQFELTTQIIATNFDPDYHLKRDGEWYAIITMPHEVVEHEGYAVPAWEGDTERRTWEENHRKRHCNR